MPRKYFAYPGISLDSLDPPGTKTPIPPALKMTIYNFVEDPKLLDIPAYETLPRALIPLKTPKYKPPVMHYGWNADYPTLLKLAADRGLTKWRQYWDYDYSDPDNENPPLVKLPPEVEKVDTIERLLDVVARELAPDLPRTPQLVGALNAPKRLAISVYTNYHLVHPPSSDFVEKLGVVLQAEKPCWYLDDEECAWTLTRSR